jgi:hypothetical protein
MRKIALLLVVLAIMALGATYYPRYVEKPVKDGNGPLAVYISPRYTAPEFHSPLEWYQRYHKDALNRGDLIQSDCLYCHEPEKSCNNCHAYVGAAAILP